MKKKAKGSKPKTKSVVSNTKLVPTKPELIGESFASFAGPSRIRATRTLDTRSPSIRFPNLYSVGLPYQYSDNYSIVMSDAILLCQKAYCRMGVFKNAVDIMSELCANSEIYLDGGNEESVSFFKAWLKRINIVKLKDQFFRELFRSGNMFFYRVEGKMTQDGAKKIKQLYAKADKVNLPLRYILLNPANIAVYGGINFEAPLYFRILNKFEVDFLKNSKNEDDKELYKNLPEAVKSYFDKGNAKPIPLDPKKLHVVFYKKQDYEPFAVPFGYAVLDSLELKLAMQKCDAVLARTVEHVILLVTMGAKKEDGGVNPESLRILQESFRTEQIGRILVSDYTTKAEFIIPELNKVFGDAKYKSVNEDIAEGLMNIFFAPTTRSVDLVSKIKVYVEKLVNAQNIFLNEFLTPEIKRVSKLMNFKSYPTPCMGKINIDDPSQIMRVYTQLLQMGVLTPKDGLEAMERGIFPEYDELHTNQEGLRKDKDKGLYEPLTGGPYTQLKIAKTNQEGAMDLQEASQEHTLEQTKLDQQHEMKTKKMDHQHAVDNPTPPAPQFHIQTKPIAGKPAAGPPNTPKPKQPTGRPPGAKAQISMAKLIDNIKLHSKLIDEVTNQYKKENKIKKITNDDKQSISTLTNSIAESEAPENWLSKAEEYVKNPPALDQDKVLDIQELAAEYGVSHESATIVYHSLIE